MDKVAVIQRFKKAKESLRGRADVCRRVSSEPISLVKEAMCAAARTQEMRPSALLVGWLAC